MNAPKRPVVPRPKHQAKSVVKEPAYLNLLATLNSNKPVRPRRPKSRHSFFRNQSPKRPVIPRPKPLTQRIQPAKPVVKGPTYLNLLATPNSKKLLRPRRPKSRQSVRNRSLNKSVRVNGTSLNSKRSIRSHKTSKNIPMTQKWLKNFVNKQEKIYKTYKKPIARRMVS